MALTDAVVRQARTSGADYTLNDLDGTRALRLGPGHEALALPVLLGGKQPRISLGTFPEVSLQDARRRRDEARALVAKGVDPRVHRREANRAAVAAAANTFETVFRRWREFKALSLKSGRQSTLEQIDRIFARDILPRIGQRSVFEIQRGDLVDVLRRIERRNASTTAEKSRTWFNQFFRWAMVEVDLETNPAADLDIVAAPRQRVRHNPFLRMEELPAFLAKLRDYQGDFRSRLGIRMLLLTGVRTGELRSATPDQFHLDTGLWVIPPVIVKQLQLRMRTKEGEIPPYIVPLSRQAIAVVKYLLEIAEPGQRYLFAKRGDLADRISENTVNGALKRLGYKGRLTGHGIRATLSTALNELGYTDKWIEAQLSHSDPNQVRAAYNHAEYIEQRRQMMQDWADRLDQWEREGVERTPPKPATPKALSEKMLHEFIEQSPGKQPEAAVVAHPASGAVSDAPTPPPCVVGRVGARPTPILTDIQRERAEMLAIFESPHNLPLPVYAKLAGKSRDQVNREIRKRRLLSLPFGNSGTSDSGVAA